MKYGRIPHIDKDISRVVQGCMMLDDRDDEKLASSFRILDDAAAQGVTCFDNAHGYGSGRCDRVFGRWLAERGNRDAVVILAKGCHHNADRRRVTPYDISADIADTLARMGTTYLDIWMFHRDDPEQPIEPLVDVLNEHIDAGRIHAYGGSNWSIDRIQAANAYAEQRGLHGFSASSPNFSLARQLDEPWTECLTISGPEHEEDRRWYAERGVPVFTWSSLARGFLSGRISRENADEVRGDFEEHVFRCYASDDNFERLERARELAGRKGLTVAQIALAYVLNQDFDGYALVAAYTAEEAAANAAAADCELSADECAWLDLRADALPV